MGEMYVNTAKRGPH